MGAVAVSEGSFRLEILLFFPQRSFSSAKVREFIERPSWLLNQGVYFPFVIYVELLFNLLATESALFRQTRALDRLAQVKLVVGILKISVLYRKKEL